MPAAKIDPAKLAGEAVETATSKSASKRQDGPQYQVLAGPFATAGEHGDAYLTQSPTGVAYLEYVPRGNGRRGKTPVTAVAAAFPSILPPEEKPDKK